MATLQNALQLTGLGTAITLSSAGNCTAPSTSLTPSVWAVWATVATAYITTTYSTALTTSTGYPVLTTQPPVLVSVPVGGQIYGVCATASSAVLTYQQVG